MCAPLPTVLSSLCFAYSAPPPKATQRCAFPCVALLLVYTPSPHCRTSTRFAGVWWTLTLPYAHMFLALATMHVRNTVWLCFQSSITRVCGKRDAQEGRRRRFLPCCAACVWHHLMRHTVSSHLRTTFAALVACFPLLIPHARVRMVSFGRALCLSFTLCHLLFFRMLSHL